MSDPYYSNTDTLFYFSCHLNVNEFDKADRQGKAAHSYSLVAMCCITHVLPLSCKDIEILQLISFRGFHRTWKLDGWNDYIIQPARDAVLNYYKVCTHDISSIRHSR